MAYDDEDTPDYGPSIGSVPQANMRKNARRGGTPNAPEVDDEPAPAEQGATAVDGIAASQATLQNRYAANPVIPANSFAPESRGASGSWETPQSRASGGVIGGGPGTPQPLPQPQSIAQPAPPPRSYAQSASFPDPVDQNTPGPTYSYVPNRPAQPGTVFQAPFVANPSNEIVGQPQPAGPSMSPIATAQAQPVAPGQPVAPPSVQRSYGMPQEGGIARGYPTGPAPVPQPEPGSITSAVRGNYSGVGATPLVPGGQTDAERNNAPFAEANRQIDQRLSARDTTARADAQSRNAALGANTNWADAWVRNRDAQSADRVAQFRATNGADMILGDRSYDQQRQGILEAAGRSSANKLIAENDLARAGAATSIAGNRNPYEDAKTAGETANRQDITEAEVNQRNQVTKQRTDEAPYETEAKRQGVAVGKLGLEGQQRIADVAKKLTVATKGKDIDQLSRQLAGLMGKDRPDQYKAYVVHGEETVDPLTNAKTKAPDRLFLIGPDGSAEDVTAAQKPQQQTAKLPGGVSPEAAVQNAQKMVKAGKISREQANAELQSYGLSQRI